MRFYVRPVLLASLLLAACSEPLTKTEQLAEACFMDQMGTRKMCNCMASAANQRLDPEVFDMFVTMGTHAPDDDSEEMREARETAASMTPAQEQQMQAFMAAAIDLCGLRM
ncbi:hypothetical protein [Henriciella litoralis]|uniref:hypothetical protein n=1 Tax=Henriciella litoralis TaxID=568102 RepID=UPI000A03489C|nr:hypothetical protein [Henriciella litoralis]